jgi:hypothetical protein
MKAPPNDTLTLKRPTEPWRKTQAESTMDARHKNKSRTTRMKEAANKVVYEGLTVSEAARTYGVSRPRLSGHVQELKHKYTEQQDRAQAAGQAEVLARVGREWNGLAEKRRVPPPLVFDDLYFNNIICPDCHVHHERPPFHDEMWAAARSDSPRTGINLPPYHAKSTVVTIKDTVYDIVSNPNSRTIIVSRAGSFAEQFMVSIQELLTNPMLYEGATRNLIDDWGPFHEPSGIWNKGQIYVAGRITPEKDPTVQALGVGSQIYGRRAEKVKFDDIADTENQRNPDRVQNMLTWIDKMALTRVGKSGKAIWVGTRVYAGDVYSFLKQRKSYEWVTYSCITDYEEEETLWPEHFPFSQAMVHKDEMTEADFQLVYQNVDIPGAGAAFPAELVEAAKSHDHHVGICPAGVRVVAGLDPAGVGKQSGYTAMTVLAVDILSGKRMPLEIVNMKGMKAPLMKDTMKMLTEKYPISEWRVEAGAVQGQLWQDPDLMRWMADHGVRVKEHFTSSKKWDPRFGVESMAALFHAGLFVIPWGDKDSQRMMQTLVEQLIQFPMGRTTDVLMSLWFAEIGARDYARRSHLPLFNSRQRVPSWVARRRRVIDLGARTLRAVPLSEQRTGILQPDRFGNQRLVSGLPVNHAEAADLASKVEYVPGRVAVNVDLEAIWGGGPSDGQEEVEEDPDVYESV